MCPIDSRVVALTSKLFWMIAPEKTSAELFRNYIPGTLIAANAVGAWDAVLFEIDHIPYV